LKELRVPESSLLPIVHDQNVKSLGDGWRSFT
jgi:hypothetical protein